VELATGHTRWEGKCGQKTGFQKKKALYLAEADTGLLLIFTLHLSTTQAIRIPVGCKATGQEIDYAETTLCSPIKAMANWPHAQWLGFLPGKDGHLVTQNRGEQIPVIGNGYVSTNTALCSIDKDICSG